MFASCFLLSSAVAIAAFAARSGLITRVVSKVVLASCARVTTFSAVRLVVARVTWPVRPKAVSVRKLPGPPWRVTTRLSGVCSGL